MIAKIITEIKELLGYYIFCVIPLCCLGYYIFQKSKNVYVEGEPAPFKSYLLFYLVVGTIIYIYIKIKY